MDKRETYKFESIVMPEHEPQVLPTATKPEPPPDPETIPERTQAVIDFTNPTGFTAKFEPVVPIGDGIKIDITSGYHDIIPHIRVQPIYPIRMLDRGIEGHVDLRFDVGAKSNTQNIIILTSLPEGSFDRAAIKAVKQWKYQPKMDDGVSVLRTGIETRLSFQMEE